MQYTSLKDVNESSQQWTVRARLVRFCKHLSPDEPNKIRRLDLVLLDDEGMAMDGQIPEAWVDGLLSKINEGSVYYIRYFQVRNAREMYKPVDHPCLMRFTAHTKVYEINPVPPQFPQYAYNLATFEILNTRIDVTSYCSDVIGILKGCSHVKLQNTSKGTRPLRNVDISNEHGETAVIALWGNHANEFEADRYMDMSNHGPVVLLFVGVTCRRFDGKLSLQGSTLCRWYANPEIPEAMTLHSSTVGRTAAASWYGPTATQATPQRITIQELATFTNPHTIYSNRYIINAKLIALLPHQSWWYLACNKCNRKTELVDGAYKCKTYKCTCNDGSPRYSVAMTAKDPMEPTNGEEPASIQLVFFGPTAKELIGVPVDSLICAHGNQTNFHPARITNLYGRQLELRISVSPRSLQRKDISYWVDSIIGVNNQPLQPPTTQATASQQAPHVVHPTSPATPISDEIRAAAHRPATQDNAATIAMAPTGSIENVQEAPTEPTSATHGLCTENLHADPTATESTPAAQPTTPPEEVDHTKEGRKGKKRPVEEAADLTAPKSSRRKLDLTD